MQPPLLAPQMKHGWTLALRAEQARFRRGKEEERIDLGGLMPQSI